MWECVDDTVGQNPTDMAERGQRGRNNDDPDGTLLSLKQRGKDESH